MALTAMYDKQVIIGDGKIMSKLAMLSAMERSEMGTKRA